MTPTHPDTQARIATLTAPAIARAADLRAVIDREVAEERARQARVQTRHVPLLTAEGEPLTARRPWDELRALPCLAPLLAEGWRLAGVDTDFVGRREAVLVREVGA